MRVSFDEGDRVEESAWQIFFSYGFRPFFLLGAMYAVAVMALFLFWIGVHHAGGQVTNMTIAMAPHVWHAHEMLFGFTIAIICGFFLTAVPNWTGSRAVQGPMLALLVAAWLAGRLAIGFSAHLPPMAVAVAVNRTRSSGSAMCTGNDGVMYVNSLPIKRCGEGL